MCLIAVNINDTPQKLWLTITVIASSLGFHTAKAGLYSILRGGSRFAEGLGGAFTDNNGYALGRR